MQFTANPEPSLGAAYAVALPAFSGPLDLLLQLIEREELDINTISLVAVTDQYVQTIEQMDEVAPGALADFLVIASRLLFLKSRSLLPQPRPPDEEDEEDGGDALVRQLLEYRLFKEMAAHLGTREAAGLRAYVRSAPRPELERRLDLGGVDLLGLHRALRRALDRLPTDPPSPRVRAYAITVAEQIDTVRALIQAAQQGRRPGGTPAPVFFTELLSRQRTRLEVIVTFLAVLELVKRREVAALQADTFGEIVLLPVD